MSFFRLLRLLLPILSRKYGATGTPRWAIVWKRRILEKALRSILARLSNVGRARLFGLEDTGDSIRLKKRSKTIDFEYAGGIYIICLDWQ
jgi:hypothetical protein